MPDAQSPTVRRRRLGIELRRLREAAGKTIEDVADLLECSVSKVSRIETGKVPVRARDVRDMLGLYGVDSNEGEFLVELSRESRQKGWWHSYSDVLPNWFESLVGLEAEASTLWSYESQYIPGLLQTEAYHRALIGGSIIEPLPAEVDRLVRLRQSRQDMLAREENPPRLWVILDEAVLHRVVGGAAVMLEQLLHLMKLASYPGMEALQIVPFTAGAHPAMAGAFLVLGFPDQTDSKVVYLEGLTSGLYLERPEDIDRYTRSFNHLRAVAMSPRDSYARIDSILGEYQ